MEPAPQQIEEDVFVGSRQTPPSKLEVSSRRDGLLEDLVVLGNIPVPEAIVRGVGLVHQDRRHQLPKGLASINSEDKSFGYCQGHSSLDAPSELNPPQRIPSPLFVALLVPQAEG